MDQDIELVNVVPNLIGQSRVRSQASGNQAPIQKQQRKDNRLLERLDLDGIREFDQARGRRSRAFWLAVVFASYATACYLPYLTFARYQIGKTIVSRQSLLPKMTAIKIPHITVCHPMNANKSYIEANVRVSDRILAKAHELGLSKSRLLTEFAKYLTAMNPFRPIEVDQHLWDLLSDLYDANFRGAEIQVFDFIVGTAFRAKEIFPRCEYEGEAYHPCASAPLFIDGICDVLLVGHRRVKKYPDLAITSFINNDTTDATNFKVEIRIPKKDVFTDTRGDSYDQDGVSVILSDSPNPILSPTFIPASSHAVITYNSKRVQIRNNCSNHLALYEHDWAYSFETCLIGTIFDRAKAICKCELPGGTIYVKNDVICTPRMVAECVRPKVFERLFESADNPIELKSHCRTPCLVESVEISSTTFFSLEGADNSSYTRISLTIRPNFDVEIVETEEFLCTIYGIASDVGGIIGVYTGLSFAAAVRALALVLNAGLKSVINKLIRSRIMPKLLKRTLPFTVLHDRRTAAQRSMRWFDDHTEALPNRRAFNKVAPMVDVPLN